MPTLYDLYEILGIADQSGYSAGEGLEPDWPKNIHSYFAVERGSDIIAGVKAYYPDATSVDITLFRKMTLPFALAGSGS